MMRMIPAPRRLMGGLLVGVAIAAGLVLAVAHAQSPPAAVPAAPPATAEPDAGAPPAGPPSANVKIVFKIIPPGNATVTWGKKRLGFIKPKAPLIVERPRDSGPLDVIVRSAGYVPVHTRAYTFTNTTVAVKITPLDKMNTIFGYREVPPPDVDGGVPPGAAGPDGGAPPAAPLPPAGP